METWKLKILQLEVYIDCNSKHWPIVKFVHVVEIKVMDKNSWRKEERRGWGCNREMKQTTRDLPIYSIMN
jgi:hypothetical protein